jgi:acyl phosphate:glycerol-3-phosphate acyltransferase
MTMPTVLTDVLLAYLLGSFSGSLLLGALRQVDIRLSGSGNAGGTNAFRSQGFYFALGVVLIDVVKGVLAAALISRLSLFGLVEPGSNSTLALWCGFAAIVGHCFPVWHGFRGGKGAATAVGVLCVIQPVALVPMLLTWLVVLTMTGWVGLATILAGISLVPAFVWLEARPAQLGFACAVALFLLFTHRSNLRKMRLGTEYRFERVMLRNWFR